MEAIENNAAISDAVKYGNDPEFTVMYIPTSDIYTDPERQRDVEERKAQFNKIMKEFNPLLVQDITVSPDPDSGKYWCIDGQMTMKVLKAKNDGKDLPVRCRVLGVKTKDERAELFCLQRGTVANVKKADILRVSRSYDKDVMQFEQITEANGLHVSWSKSTSRKDGYISQTLAHGEYKKFSTPEAYGQFISVLKQAWGGTHNSMNRQLVCGLGMFMRLYAGQINVDDLIVRLRAKSPDYIKKEATGDVSSATKTVKYARQIMRIYNSKRANRLPDLLSSGAAA